MSEATGFTKTVNGISLLRTASGEWKAKSRSGSGWHELTPAGCTCPGFRYRRQCAHFDAFLSALGWSPAPREATPEEKLVDELTALVRSTLGTNQDVAKAAVEVVKKHGWAPQPTDHRDIKDRIVRIFGQYRIPFASPTVASRVAYHIAEAMVEEVWEGGSK